MKRSGRLLLILALTVGSLPAIAAASGSSKVGINILLNQPVSTTILQNLAAHGQVRDVLPQINTVMLYAPASNLGAIKALAYVAAAALDTEVTPAPIDGVEEVDFVSGLNTWNMDAINVSNHGVGRTIGYTGAGVYVAVLDTGLLSDWRRYFPEQRIAQEYAKAFGGGGNSGNNISEQPHKWERDTFSHGTHVTSTIIGYDLLGTSMQGVAPQATIIPVKVLGQDFRSFGSIITYGIVYIADLKAGPLADHPVVINMSFRAPPDPVMEAAINYAISKGVIVVAAAHNEGAAGMTYPAAYPQVISAGAVGWEQQWTVDQWWDSLDVEEPTDPNEFYIAPFSAPELPGQDLDVVAPGVDVLGPYQYNQGHRNWLFLNGTSMASPHVAGAVALMAEKYPALSPAQAESILENTALPLSPGCSTVIPTFFANPVEYCWGANATSHGLLQVDRAVAATP